ncbi:MAG: hypothetical protein IPL36_05380 [Nigerium sp.]|nr:hypothetical protein [Nigerium sp.]
MNASTANLTREQTEALDVARHLAAHGVPLLLARPILDADGRLMPTEGAGGYRMPTGWEATQANPAVVDQWRPGMALCAVMGHAVDGLDVDPRTGGQDTANGWAAAGLYPRSYGQQSTPSGGWHDLIVPLGVGSKDGASPGVDVKGGRADGTSRGFLFIAPTVKAVKGNDGKLTGEFAAYQWTTEPDLTELDDNDDTGVWLADLILRTRPSAKRRESTPADRAEFDKLSEREQARIGKYLDAVVAGLKSELEDASRWPVGHRDDRGRGWQKLVADVAYRLGALARAPWSPWSIGDAYKALQGIVPARMAASVHPGREWAGQAHKAPTASFPPPPAGGQSRGDGTGTTGTTPSAAPTAWGDANLASHQRIAARFVTYARGKCLFVNGGGWHYWDGARWAPDTDAAHAYGVLKEMITLSWMEAMTDKALFSDVRSAMSAMGSRGVLEIASKTLRTEQVDADPWLLNCQNGTLDLHTLQLRAHDPADMLTKVCKAAYTPGATSPAWDYLTTTSILDPEVRGFLQRYAGVSLVGRVIEHILVILTGDGRNGKGMTARTIGKALGDYAITGAASMLVAGRQGDKPSAQDLAAQYRLRGTRWAVLSEVQKGARMDEATTKQLTGGDEIQAKLMGQNPIDFAPSHSLIMLANDLPTVDPDAKALWARLRAVPFTVDYTGREDKTLDERLEAELEGVLAWCVAGLKDYMDRGRKLDEPDAVLARTADYRNDNDALGRFIAEECIEHRGARVTKAELVDAYTEWAQRNREERLSARAIGARLKTRNGISEYRTSRGGEWLGLALRSDANRNPGPDGDPGEGRPDREPAKGGEDRPNPENPVTRQSAASAASPSHSHEEWSKGMTGRSSTYSTPPGSPSAGRPSAAPPALVDPGSLDPHGRCRLHHDRPLNGCYTCGALAGVA